MLHRFRALGGTYPRFRPQIGSIVQGRWMSNATVPPGITTLLENYASIPLERTRNFAIVAHVDHGKSISFQAHAVLQICLVFVFSSVACLSPRYIALNSP